MRSRQKTQNNATLTPELREQMEAMWKSLYASGKVDRPYDRERFDFLAKLFEGKLDGQGNESSSK